MQAKTGSRRDRRQRADPRRASTSRSPTSTRWCALTAHDIADMIEAGWNVVVTHGNGPQVGFILRRSELSIHEVPPVPMDYAGADIQGAIGYMFVKALAQRVPAARHRRGSRSRS